MIYKCKKCGFKTETQVECTCGSPMKIVLSRKPKIFIALGGLLLILIFWRANFALEYLKTFNYFKTFLTKNVNVDYMFFDKLYAEDSYMSSFFEAFFNLENKQFNAIKFSNDEINEFKLRLKKRNAQLDNETIINQLK